MRKAGREQPPGDEPGGDPTAEERQAAEDRRTERLVRQLAQQWGRVREPKPQPEPAYRTGPSNFTRAQVPWGYDVAAAWAWRFIVIVLAVLIVLTGIKILAVMVFPVVIALFIAALVAPVVNWVERWGVPRKLAAFLVVLGGIAIVAALIAFVTQQVASGAGELSDNVAGGLGKIEDWLRDGPLNLTDSQVNDWIGNAQDYIKDQGKDLASHASELSTTVSHIFAAFFIILFSTFFFLADGKLIWAWVVRIFPRAARNRVDSSGRVAWRSLTQFVRATVLVAGTDAIGIMIFAAILKVPLISAIGVLVFLGAFVPLIGAFVSGGVAVLVALVAHGPVVALIMLGGVVLVQQIEAHVLQPFLMGRFVSVHPLGVILSIAAGVILAGVVGALVAVPLAAIINAVVQHLASFTDIGESPVHASADDSPPESDAEIDAEVAGEPQ
jgi:predicted PurR-regulated permease PerM